MEGISIKNLNKIYPNGNRALKNISMDIPAGMFGLLGPNGAGKSTLMRILVSLLEPTSGEVSIFGYDLKQQRREVRSLLGYLPQDFRFFAKYKTGEFLDYAARLSGINNSKTRRRRVDEMLETVGLFDVRERYAAKLSGGMKRRLGIAQALIHNPKVIIVDEPTTGLDPEERIRFRNLLSATAEKNVAIILSTHIVGDISSSCNCMALMNQGEVSFFGSPEEMMKQAEGKVWRLYVTDEELREIDRLYPVVVTIPSGTGWEVQVVADEVRGFDATPCQPNLEHAYVRYMETSLNQWNKA